MPTNPRYHLTRVVTPATSMALMTLDEAKAALGIPLADTSHDAALTMQIEAVSVAANQYCNRVFVVQTYQDTFRYLTNWLYSGQPLRTRQFPIVVDEGVPLVAVIENGAELDGALWEVYPEQGALYRLDGGLVGEWLGTSIIVDYTAGYDPIPPDVRSAALEWLGARWGGTGRDPSLRSETIPDLITQVYDSGASSSAGTTAIPGGTRDLLAPYRIWAV